MLYHVFYREVSTLVFDIILLQCKYKENRRKNKKHLNYFNYYQISERTILIHLNVSFKYRYKVLFCIFSKKK